MFKRLATRPTRARIAASVRAICARLRDHGELSNELTYRGSDACEPNGVTVVSASGPPTVSAAARLRNLTATTAVATPPRMNARTINAHLLRLPVELVDGFLENVRRCVLDH